MAKRAGIMLAYGYEEKRFLGYGKPCIVQPKLEGDRCRCEIQNPGQVKLISSGMKERVSVPHIFAELRDTELSQIELDGELYVHGMPHEGGEKSIRSIVSRTVNLHPDYLEMEYHLFDIASENIPQDVRIEALRDIFSKYEFKYIKFVESLWVNNTTELQWAYEKFLDQGYEGIIIRDPAAVYTRRKVTTMMKLKPHLSDTFEIIGFQEEKTLSGESKGVLGALILQTDEGRVFNVGTGPTDYQRALLWEHRESLLGFKCKIRFQAFTKVRQVPKMQSMDKEWLVNVQRVLEGVS